MVLYRQANLDTVFSALSDPTRRGILAALCAGKRSVSDLAEPFEMSLTGFTKHLRVLEDAGLVQCGKSGRVVHCALTAAPLQSAADWLAHYQMFWTSRLDALAAFLNEQEPSCPPNPPILRLRSSASTRTRRKRSGTRGPRSKR